MSVVRSAALSLASLLLIQATVIAEPSLSADAKAALEANCFDCHDSSKKKGGLDLSALPFSPQDPTNRAAWIRIHDRVRAGEMPPKSADLEESDRRHLLEQLSTALLDADSNDIAKNGRGPLRRLTRGEYQQTLRDLLDSPDLEIKDLLPEDREKHLFTRTAEALEMSRVQLDAYLDAAEAALRSAVVDKPQPPAPQKWRIFGTNLFPGRGTFGNKESMFFAKNNRSEEFRGKDKRDLFEAASTDPTLEMALFRSASWPYIGTPKGFIAPHTGRYTVRFSARAVLQQADFVLRPAHAPVPMTFRTRKPAGADIINEVRAEGGTLDIQPKTSTYEVSVRLKAGESVEYSLLGLPMPLARNPNGSAPTYRYPPFPEGGQPGIAYQWLEIEGPIAPPAWPPSSHQSVLGELGIDPAPPEARIILASKVRDFIQRAAKEPLEEETTAKFERIALKRLEEGSTFTSALLSACQAFLASPHFIFLHEPSLSATPQHAIAARLSHFLSNTGQDSRLRQLADANQLLNPDVLERETLRLVESPAFERFIQEFTDQWLNLRHIKRDDPDIRLFPEYRFDEYLVESLEKETRAFVTALFRDNRPASHLIQSDFVMLNDRLAKHYGLSPISGSALRKCELPKNGVRGGLLTQGAILKVSANGTNTSPVIRGAWVTERLLGTPPPPPPANVPAVEPDIRGAKTIRELIALHTRSESCATCHAKFDPFGLALENFDVLGGWRDTYRGLEHGQHVSGIDRAGHDFRYTLASSVDPSGKMQDGQSFRDVRDLKRLLLRDQRQLARNILSQLTTYATGTPIRFADRSTIEAILDESASTGFRVRDLLVLFVKSNIFSGQKRTTSR